MLIAALDSLIALLAAALGGGVSQSSLTCLCSDGPLHANTTCNTEPLQFKKEMLQSACNFADTSSAMQATGMLILDAKGAALGAVKAFIQSVHLATSQVVE